MNRNCIVGLMLFCGINSMGQGIETQIRPHLTLSNGVVVRSVYNHSLKELDFFIENNSDVVEIIAVDRNAIVDSNDTIFEDDTIKLSLPDYKSGEIHIYARTREEFQYIGSVRTESK